MKTSVGITPRRTRGVLVAVVASLHMPSATSFVLRGWFLEVSGYPNSVCTGS